MVTWVVISLCSDSSFQSASNARIFSVCILERRLGRDDAMTVAKSIEESLSHVEERSKEIANIAFYGFSLVTQRNGMSFVQKILIRFVTMSHTDVGNKQEQLGTACGRFGNR